jgi:hypothetical protein
MTPDKIDLFWRRVARSADSECWLWTGARDGLGYGLFLSQKCGIRPPGQFTRRTHRVAFYLAYGREPSGLVCHKCDNPPCCNPKHLFEGSDADNNMDCRDKGRQNAIQGSAVASSVLTEAQVTRMRAEYKTGLVTQAALCKKYGVSDTTIAKIIHRRGWTHIL